MFFEFSLQEYAFFKAFFNCLDNKKPKEELRLCSPSFAFCV